MSPLNRDRDPSPSRRSRLPSCAYAVLSDRRQLHRRDGCLRCPSPAARVRTPCVRHREHSPPEHAGRVRAATATMSHVSLAARLIASKRPRADEPTVTAAPAVASPPLPPPLLRVTGTEFSRDRPRARDSVPVDDGFLDSLSSDVLDALERGEKVNLPSRTAPHVLRERIENQLAREAEARVRKLARNADGSVSASGAGAGATAAASGASATLANDFSKQQDAFVYADAQRASGAEKLKIFSCEFAAGGARRFFAASADAIWSRLLRTPLPSRHFYEILREDTPVHLYFDLEFNASSDAPEPVAPADASVAFILFRVARALHGEYGVSLRAEHVIHLESSTERKFSRHLVLRLPDGSRWRCTNNAGAFVHALVDALAAERAALREAGGGGGGERGAATSALEAQLLESLWRPRAPPTAAAPAALPESAIDSSSAGVVATQSPLPCRSSRPTAEAEQFLVDTGVYTRNRAMRVMLSAKFGKRIVLMPAACDRSQSAEALPGDPLTLDYWLSYVVPSQVAGNGGDGWDGREGADGEDGGGAGLGGPLPSAERPWTPPLVLSGDKAWERRYFFASFITDFLPPLWTLTASAGDAARVPTSAEMREFTPTQALGCRILYAKVPPADAPPTLGLPLNPRVGSSPRPLAAAQHSARAGGAGQVNERDVDGSGAAPPFPDLFEWVCGVARGDWQGAQSTRIRSWSGRAVDVAYRIGDGALQTTRIFTRLQLNIGRGGGVCANIGRPHRSNEVYWCVVVQNGIAWQRCFDIECRGFRGPPVAVPPELLPEQLPAGAIVVAMPERESSV